MNAAIENMPFYDSRQSEYNFNKPYSEATAERIDVEVKKIIDSAFARTKSLLREHRQHLETIAQELLEKEILFQSDLERLIGKRPFAQQTTYQKFTNGVSKEQKEKDEKNPLPHENSSLPEPQKEQ